MRSEALFWKIIHRNQVEADLIVHLKFKELSRLFLTYKIRDNIIIRSKNIDFSQSLVSRHERYTAGNITVTNATGVIN